MLVADAYLGHREDPSVAGALADADSDRVVLTDTDRRRSRVRTGTADGRDLGIVVGRDLRDGDVIEARDGTLIVVELATVAAVVLDFADADLSPTAALAVGHALGNRHWDLAVRGTEALFPVADSRERTRAVVADVVPDGVTTRFEDVPPTTFDAAGPDHGHGDGHEDGDGDGHGHGGADHTHSHAHPHADGDEHAHERHEHRHDGEEPGGHGSRGEGTGSRSESGVREADDR